MFGGTSQRDAGPSRERGLGYAPTHCAGWVGLVLVGVSLATLRN